LGYKSNKLHRNVKNNGRKYQLFLSIRTRVYLLIILNALLFSNTLKNEFAYDDLIFIISNPGVHNPGRISSIFAASFPENLPELSLYRPLTAVTYLVDWRRGTRNIVPLEPTFPDHISTFWFHMTNIMLHIGVVLLIYFMVRRIYKEETTAFVTALFFSVHPVHVESIASIVGRAESLCAFFYLASLMLFIREREKSRIFTPLLLTSYLLYLASLLSKESAITLPVVILMTDWFLEKGEENKGWHSFPGKGIIRTVPYIAISFIYISWRLHILGFWGISPSVWYFTDDPAVIRLAGMCAGALVYLRLLAFPIAMSMDYNFPVRIAGPLWAAKPGGLTNLWALAGLLIIILLLIWIIRAVLKKRPSSFALLFFVFTFFPYANIIPIGEFIAERFLYLPSVGFCLILGIFTAKLVERQKIRTLSLLLLSVLLIFYSARTFLRNRDWASSLSLWRAEEKFNPGNPNLNYGFGLEYQKKRMYHLVNLAKAPDQNDADRINRHRQLAQEYEALTRNYFEASLRKNPRHYLTHLNYGVMLIYLQNPELARAEEALLQGAACMPENILHLHNFYQHLGVVQLLKNPPQTDQALYYFEKSYRLKKNNIPILLGMAHTHILMQKYDDALAICREILKREPAERSAILYIKILRSAYWEGKD
jgi:tetratricopeptide (TPR) repeat protein